MTNCIYNGIFCRLYGIQIIKGDEIYIFKPFPVVQNWC